MEIRDMYKEQNYFLVTFAVQGMGVMVGVSQVHDTGSKGDVVGKIITPRTEKQWYHAIVSKQRVRFDMVFSFSKTEQGVPTMSGLGRMFGMITPSFDSQQIVAEDVSPNNIIRQLFGQLLDKSEETNSKIVKPAGFKRTIGERTKFIINGEVVGTEEQTEKREVTPPPPVPTRNEEMPAEEPGEEEKAE